LFIEIAFTKHTNIELLYLSCSTIVRNSKESPTLAKVVKSWL